MSQIHVDAVRRHLDANGYDTQTPPSRRSWEIPATAAGAFLGAGAAGASSKALLDAGMRAYAGHINRTYADARRAIPMWRKVTGIGSPATRSYIDQVLALGKAVDRSRYGMAGVGALTAAGAIVGGALGRHFVRHHLSDD